MAAERRRKKTRVGRLLWKKVHAVLEATKVPRQECSVGFSHTSGGFKRHFDPPAVETAVLNLRVNAHRKEPKKAQAAAAVNNTQLSSVSRGNPARAGEEVADQIQPASQTSNSLPALTARPQISLSADKVLHVVCPSWSARRLLADSSALRTL